MRTAFVKALTEAASKDIRIMLLVGDLGFGVVTDFAKRFPKQFLNVGVAEQNMAGVAAGLALSGHVVFTYSIANFPIIRCLEQIRNDICYHEANVISVSVGSGFCYGALGMTHHGTEDIAMMRSLPGMNVVSPGDPVEAKAATEYLAQGIGPAFLRLGRAGEPVVHEQDINWQFGKAIKVRQGRDVAVIATGSMLKRAVDAAAILHQKGLETTVLSMHTIKPLDTEAVLEVIDTTPMVFTLEEHSIFGGLGGAVAEIVAEHGTGQSRFKRIGLPSVFTKHVGDQDYLLKQYRLTAETIAEDILCTYFNK
ncbi:MAG: hypothetical protein FWE67_01600 [Planctomycetaceae bacterium]|nr:hypothetical protein [Planctomycetaceae bacterium]